MFSETKIFCRIADKICKMKIKGTGVINLKDYMLRKHKEDYDKWLMALPPASKKIFSNIIFNTNWYDLKDSVLIPSKVAADKFYGGDFESFLYITGQFNGEEVLNGIYKFFIKISSIDYVMSKASLVFDTYYSDGSIDIETGDNFVVTLYGFSKEEEKWFINISGWIDSLYKLVTRGKQKYKVSWQTIYEDSNNKVIGKIFIDVLK